jgi:hypothetical protein
MIVQNAVICNKCDDFIVSKHRHDFVTCKCGDCTVDGGQSYLRRVYKTNASFSELSWSIEDEIYKECAEAVEHAIDTNRNKFGIANAVLRALRAHDRAIGEKEPRIMAENKDLEEIMIVESDGTVNRYKKVVV